MKRRPVTAVPAVEIRETRREFAMDAVPPARCGKHSPADAADALVSGRCTESGVIR
jgi:hypothetical protein